MLVKLSQIAKIQMGYSFRSRLELMERGGVAVIQMKDLTGDNRVDCDGLTRIGMEIREHHLVLPGDLIFRSRGQVTTSAILTKDPGEAVVAAPLFRIRVTDNSAMPEYLNWYISQRDAQIFLTSRAKGTVQKMISNKRLKNWRLRCQAWKNRKTS